MVKKLWMEVGDKMNSEKLDLIKRLVGMVERGSMTQGQFLEIMKGLEEMERSDQEAKPLT